MVNIPTTSSHCRCDCSAPSRYQLNFGQDHVFGRSNQAIDDGGTDTQMADHGSLQLSSMEGSVGGKKVELETRRHMSGVECAVIRERLGCEFDI